MLYNQNMRNLKDILEKTKKNVKKSSKLMFDKEINISEKSNCSNLVTDKDEAVQKFLFKNLSKLIPESNFLAEETDGKIDNESEYTWIIDPIDGTTNFIRNMKYSAISVALKYKTDIVLGVVYAPFTKEMFWAIKDGGAYLNGKQIKTSNRLLKESIFSTSLCVYKKEFAQASNKVLMEIYPQISDIRRLGSCALELCYLACGRIDLYFEMNVCPWDCAAAYVVVKEAGGLISALQRNDIDFLDNKSVIAANNLDNYDKLITVVDKYIKGK